MKNSAAFLATFIALAFASNANALVIDFEDVPITTTFANTIETPQGFTFGNREDASVCGNGEAPFWEAPRVFRDDEKGNVLTVLGVTGQAPFVYNFWRQDGKLFNLNSMELLAPSLGDSIDGARITGYDAEGNIIAGKWLQMRETSDSLTQSWETFEFGGEWQNLY